MSAFSPGRRLATGFVVRGAATWLPIRLLVGVQPGLVLLTPLVFAAAAGEPCRGFDPHRGRHHRDGPPPPGGQ